MPDTYAGLIPVQSPYPLTEAGYDIGNTITYMLAKTQSMFRYNGLPDSIPQRDLEYIIQQNGFAAIARVKGELYALYGNMGGESNAYRRPTHFIYANPALGSDDLVIDKDCVIIPNDSMYMGLIPMMRKYATLLHDNEVSLWMADILSRVPALIGADDDNTKASAEEALKCVAKGELAVISTSRMIDSLNLQTFPFGTQSHTGGLTDLIEVEQYLKAGFWNDIGLNANYNMKREAINSTEAQMNGDALLPFVDDMLNVRKLALEKVNAMFETNITIEFASAWEDNMQELEAQQEILESAESEEAEAEEVSEDENTEAQ